MFHNIQACTLNIHGKQMVTFFPKFFCIIQHKKIPGRTEDEPMYHF